MYDVTTKFHDPHPFTQRGTVIFLIVLRVNKPVAVHDLLLYLALIHGDGLG